MQSLKSDHETLEELLSDLIRLLKKPDIQWAFELLDLFCAKLTVHICAENVCLFPAILGAPADAFSGDNVPSREEVKATIERLKSDHMFFIEELGQAVKLMRPLLDEQPSEETREILHSVLKATAAVAIRMAHHQEIEEKNIYRWTQLLLTFDEMSLLEAGVVESLSSLPESRIVNRE